MICDVPQESSLPAACFVYRPGDARQDLYTIPAELLAVFAVSSIKPPANPRWPFTHESANEEIKPTRHSGTFAFGLATSLVVPMTGLILKENPEFPLMAYARGAVHAHLWTEFLTSSAKNYFGRKRPFFETAARQGQSAVDNRRSFFSGHAAHSFTFATYASQVAFDQFEDSKLGWLFSGLLYSTALWVGSSRAVDHQHNWSDVLTGAAVGSSIGFFTFQRVRDVQEKKFRVSVTPGQISGVVFLK